MRVGGADGGGKCIATLRNLPGEYGTPSSAHALAYIDASRRLLVATTEGGKLAWWDLDSLDSRTGGWRSYEYDAQTQEHQLLPDAGDAEGGGPALLSVDAVQNVCHHEDGIDRMEVTEGEAPHGVWSLNVPLEQPKPGSSYGRHSPATSHMEASALCWLVDPAYLAVAFDGRGRTGDGVLGSEVRAVGSEYKMQTLRAPCARAGVPPHHPARLPSSAFTFAQVVALYDVNAGRSAGLLVGHAPNGEGYVTLIGALAAGGAARPHTLASACTDGTVKVWDTRECRAKLTLVDKARGDTSAAAFAPAGGAPLLFTGSSDCAIRLWDLRNAGRCVYELATGNARVEALAWDPGGHALLALLERARPRRQESDSDDEDGAGWGAWPPDAQHAASDFGVQWDQPAGECALAQYRFKAEPRQPDRSYALGGVETPAKWSFISEAYGRGVGL